MITAMQIKSLEKNLGMKIDNFSEYSDGFSFTVQTELEAYKAAFKYRGCENTWVKYAPNVSAWSVQVYTKK